MGVAPGPLYTVAPRSGQTRDPSNVDAAQRRDTENRAGDTGADCAAFYVAGPIP